MKMRVTSKRVNEDASVIDFILTNEKGREVYVLTVCTDAKLNTIGVFANGNSGVRFVTGVMSSDGLSIAHQEPECSGCPGEQMGLFPS